MTKTVTIFGSSFPQEGDEEYTLAYELGKQLAKAGFTICNGGFAGTMTATAKGATEIGGSTIGVTFNYAALEANPYIQKEYRAKTLFERVSFLMTTGDAYVILKGGTGTLLELAAVWESVNKRMMHEKPIIIMGEYWESLIQLVGKESIREGRGDCSRFIRRADSVNECVRLIKEMLKI
jgi:uncharacterized protein (TIGR00730 family)